jgi:hypothetical protein
MHHPLGLLVTALLALLCLPTDAGTPQSTGTIPSLDATVTFLRFFEGEYQAPLREQRAYTQRFERAQTRYVHWGLPLAHPAPGRRRVFSIQSVWYHPDGHILARLPMHTVVEADWTWSYHYASWHATGGWAAGTYRVELYVRGQQIAVGQEPLGRLLIALLGQQDVNRLAYLIHAR